jgi:hypothetical protein
MCGLLALSASHLAALSDDEIATQSHQMKSDSLFQEFSVGWAELVGGTVTVDIEQAKTGAQILCLQYCRSWTTSLSTVYQETIQKPEPMPLNMFTTALQGCINPELALRSVIRHDATLEQALANSATHALDSSSEVVAQINTPSAILDRFRNLPYGMSVVLEKPNHPLDFFATVAALDTLVECCALSYASDDIRATWVGMESWLVRISDHFRRMVWRQTPAALIIFAHWSLLVQRTESHSWFLNGSTTKILDQIEELFPINSRALSLIKGLRGEVQQINLSGD